MFYIVITPSSSDKYVPNHTKKPVSLISLSVLCKITNVIIALGLCNDNGFILGTIYDDSMDLSRSETDAQIQGSGLTLV